MAGLQRSEVSFRRQGSSGLVWDDKFFSGDFGQVEPVKELQEATKEAESREPNRPQSSTGNMRRSRSHNVGEHSFWTAKVPAAAVDPPSPKVPGCGLCSIPRKPKTAHPHKPGKS